MRGNTINCKCTVGEKGRGEVGAASRFEIAGRVNVQRRERAYLTLLRVRKEPLIKLHRYRPACVLSISRLLISTIATIYR